MREKKVTPIRVRKTIFATLNLFSKNRFDRFENSYVFFKIDKCGARGGVIREKAFLPVCIWKAIATSKGSSHTLDIVIRIGRPSPPFEKK